MIKELINFSESLSEDFKAIGKLPKEGLHILLQVKDDGTLNLSADAIQYGYFNKKMEEVSPFLTKCLLLQENSWMVDTNKCLDTTTRAIHSCSAYSVGIKRDNLKGGANYEKRMKEGKNLVYGSFETYFQKANEILNTVDETKSPIADAFSSFFENGSWEIVLEDVLNQRDAKYQLMVSKENDLKVKLRAASDKNEKMAINEELKNLALDTVEHQPLADSDYIIFYLDLPLEDYKSVHSFYLDDKLFNTAEYNTEPDEDGVIYGTSNFMNSYNQKMPFLMHRSATFDVSSRISNADAKALYEFSIVFGNKTLPNPLPIFIYHNELFEERVFALYKEGKRNFRDIITSLNDDFKDDFQNYYLLNWSNTKDGVVFNDYDFVSRFRYKLNDDVGVQIENLFELKAKEGEGKAGFKDYRKIEDIFELEDRVLKYLIQNKYHRVNYFSDFKTEEYEKLPLTFLSFNKYRKAVYDYVYKSTRTVIGGKEFDEMIFNAIQDDFKNGNEYGIKEKLNYWYSLYNFFHNNTINMASKLKEFQDFVSALIDGSAAADEAQDEHFAFAAGQVIYYLLNKSKSADTSFRLMEPYLQKTNCKALQENIAEDFARYKHENFSNNFAKVAAFVLSYETSQNLKKLQPQLLSGLFSKNQLFSNKTTTENQ